MRAGCFAFAIISFLCVSSTRAKEPLKAPLAAPTKVPGKPAPPSEAYRPPPELDQSFSPLLGSWMCRGAMPASPFSPLHEFVGQLRVRKDLNGFWYVAEYRERRTANNPMPMATQDIFTYDPHNKRFMRAMFDNSGGYAHLFSKGWEGNTMLWNGDASMTGGKLPMRHHITKENDRRFSDRFEVQKDGKWTELSRGVCQKGSLPPAVKQADAE